MCTRLLTLATLAILFAGSACTAILDLESNESECWCGEQWIVQVSGATALNSLGVPWSIPASEAISLTCVSQLEHLALDAADPQDPVYVAMRSSLESAAIAKCEAAGAAQWGVEFASTDCATTGTAPVSTNLVHTGACWKSENWDKNEYCPLFPECRLYYDCSAEPIWDGGDDEAGADVEWECLIN